MNPGRRRLLQALGLGLAGSAGWLPRPGRAETPRPPQLGEARLLRRWATDNRRLAPVTLIPAPDRDGNRDHSPVPSPGRNLAISPEGPRYASPASSADAAPTVSDVGSYPSSPAALAAARLLFAGETTLGLVDPAVADVLWQRPHHLPGGAVFRPRATADTLLGAGRGALGVWGLANGEPRWRREAQRQFGVPGLTAEAIFVGDGHELLALDLASGDPRWRFAAVADTQISYAPAVTRDKVLVGPGDGRLYALDRYSGQLLWERHRAADWKYLRQLHLASEDLLVAGGYTEKLYGIDLRGGELRWTFNAGNFINSHHLSGDAAFLWSPTGWIYALDVHSGEVRWRHRTTAYRGEAQEWAPLMAELASADGRLFALDMNSVLHVLDLGNGEELARYPLAPVQPFVTPLSGQEIAVGSTEGEIWLLALEGPASASLG